MRYKTATEKMHSVKAYLVDRETKEGFNLPTKVFADMKEKEIESFLEDMAFEKTHHQCRLIDYEILETHDYTFRLEYTKYLNEAELWKVDGVVVK